ncbi:unnamed protein product [Cuscuta epithymum]|uniref:CCHC-type domain-containing protein n=1 Tax=Cuscuta epithymum TaxID=186058 RepID=A0AAV0DCV4_9ASTE|nr:unnamed protein product [Cuscuta epithymum]
MEYFTIMQGFIDDLITIGHPLPDGQIMSYILTGFGSEFKETTGALRVLETPLPFASLRSHFLHAEMLAAGDISDTSITANYTQRRGSNNNYRGRGDRGRGGRGRSRQNTGVFSYQNGSSFNSQRIICQLCDKDGHTARQCYSMRAPSPTAHVADGSHTSGNNANWLLDTGATHHITSDLNNLAIHSDYNGSDSVMMGNGNGVPISHTGTTGSKDRGILGARPE